MWSLRPNSDVYWWDYVTSTRRRSDQAPLNLEEKFLERGWVGFHDIMEVTPTTTPTMKVYNNRRHLTGGVIFTISTSKVTITASDGFCSESISFTIEVYLDTDVDANNMFDLDDDNDGILDVDEGCYYGALEFDGNQVLWNSGEYSNCPGRPYH